MLTGPASVNDIAPAKIPPENKATKEGPKAQVTGVRKRQESTASQPTSDDEYVYDVYFKGNAEPTSSDWNNLGNYGTLCVGSRVLWLCAKWLTARRVGLPPESRGDDEDSDDGEVESEYESDDDSNGSLRSPLLLPPPRFAKAE